MGDISDPEAQLIGLIVECILYGLYLVSLGRCLYLWVQSGCTSATESSSPSYFRSGHCATWVPRDVRYSPQQPYGYPGVHQLWRYWRTGGYLREYIWLDVCYQGTSLVCEAFLGIALTFSLR